MVHPFPRHVGNITLLCLLATAAGWVSTANGAWASEKAAAEGLSADELLAHIKVLSSDEFEGRAPGTPGEDRSVDYLTGQFRALGLKPGNPDGTFLQSVPL